MYPHPGLPYSGTFIQKCVVAASEQGHEMVGLVPRPFFPIPSSLYPRLKTYAQIPKYSEADGFPVHRPNQWQVPKVKVDWQQHHGSFLQMRGIAKKLHAQHNFDAILSFNLLSAGGLAWRLGKLLDIPSVGWAFGTDVRVPVGSEASHSLRETIENLDLFFYQSSELKECGASYLPDATQLDPKQHVVLPHGIPKLTKSDGHVGQRLRSKWGVDDDAIVALFLSRVVKDKGIFELVEAFDTASKQNRNLHCIAVGESPGFDDSERLRNELQRRKLADRFQLLPACKPDEVPDYHAAADIFVFPSHNEGMPNALLEAMLLGTPAIAFEIPPIMDVQAHGECLKLVPLGDSNALSEALVELSLDAELRDEMVEAASRVVSEHFDVSTNMRRAIELMSKFQTLSS